MCHNCPRKVTAIKSLCLKMQWTHTLTPLPPPLPPSSSLLLVHDSSYYLLDNKLHRLDMRAKWGERGNSLRILCVCVCVCIHRLFNDVCVQLLLFPCLHMCVCLFVCSVPVYIHRFSLCLRASVRLCLCSSASMHRHARVCVSVYVCVWGIVSAVEHTRGGAGGLSAITR